MSTARDTGPEPQARQALSLEDLVLLMSRRRPADLSHEQLIGYVERLALSDDLIAALSRFRETEYARNLVCRTPEFELLVLCWRPGHESTIHDHGGSLNAIKVHRGRLTSRLFAAAVGTPPKASGPVTLTEEQTVMPGGELAGIGRDGIHQLANRSDQDLVTIHVYAPPLMTLTVYSEHDAGTELRPLRYTLHDDMH